VTPGPGDAAALLLEWRAPLRRTPVLLEAWLRELPGARLEADEGPGTWNALAIVGHLIEGERSDWLPRARHLLEHGEARPFPPFDRLAQLRHPGRSIGELLDTFAAERARSLADLAALQLTAADLQRTGTHPEFGRVTLRQHLATWVAHDLSHVAQIARVMARRMGAEVGPWRAYLRLLAD